MSSKRIPLTRTATFSPFLCFLESGGCDVTRGLSSARIDPELLSCPENLIPLRRATWFLEHMQKTEGVESLGLEVGKEASAAGLGLFGRLLCESLTLRDLIDRMVRWIPALDSGAKVWLEYPKGRESLKFCLRHDTDAGRAIADGYAIFLLIDAFRLAAGKEWRPRRIWLDHAAGKNLSNYEALAESEECRDVNYIAVEIPMTLLPMPVPQTLPGTAGPGLTASETAFAHTSPHEDLAGSIRQVLRNSLGRSLPTIQDIADLAGCSVRTLQRRLSESAVTYGEIVDRERYEGAMRLLQEEHAVPLAEVSRYLGYSDAAHFTHAFRRWTGISPSRYRRMSLPS